MSRDHLVRTFRDQAGACLTLGSPLYAALLDRCAHDIDAGGPVARLLQGHETDAGSSATALRLMGGVHRLVLEGTAPRLAAWYPSAGGTADPERAWPAFRDVLVEQADRVAAALEQAPQTNEVGRAAALLGGLLHVVGARPLPVVLHEIGASAGLNLRADHYWYSAADPPVSWGPPHSAVRLAGAWSGRTPPTAAALRIVARHGSDIAPVDPNSAEGRVRLLSYVWADQPERFARVDAALEIALEVPVEVERCDALTAVRRLSLAAGRWTVLWHSVMWQYLDSDEQDAINRHVESLGADAAADAPFARLSLEPMRRSKEAEHEFLVTLQTWPGGAHLVLGSAPPHGIPTTWEL